MRNYVPWLSLLLLGAGACRGEEPSSPTDFIRGQRIVYSDDLHNENTEMLALEDRILLVFRGGETGQIGSQKAHINIFSSPDHGRTFAKLSEVSGKTLLDDRDIRDPKLVEMNGKLYLYAISRLPGGHYRDFFGQAWTVRAESTDRGATWSEPVRTYTDPGRFWGFWRFTKRAYKDNGVSKETLYALGYDDGDSAVGVFASADGVSWEKVSLVVDSYDDVPSEAELQFFGDNNQTAVALVRMDNQGILQDGQTAICTAQAPFDTWECNRRIEQRLDGPTWISRDVAGVRRNFVVARKHLPCTAKRTAVYELRGNPADPQASISVCEIQELKSAGDTAYTAVAPLGDDSFLVSWYSSTIPAMGDVPWLQGTYSPSDIWLADMNLAAAPSDCKAPPPKMACPLPHLPAGQASWMSGSFLLTVAPVIYPVQTISFQATVALRGTSLDLTLQPLDAMTKMAVGVPWKVTGVALASDATFSANFGTQSMPPEAFALLSDPFLKFNDFVMTGKATSADAFCGYVTGHAQIVGMSPSDRIDLAGSSFGAARTTGSLPEPVSRCPAP